ncbi:3-hydroxyacyl-[acyl-carrier-protein] dehydratase FabZ [Lentzea sp. NBRC 105346]|uniref:3-hydroxyacyl-ACP dehydratase FabZ family protein n=1 Tax=Lentzea sp. NBRC 105346 TaxID=3032205 RepID=UPI0024A0E0DB|nr:hypothetical protein [Lentzea sp. NBRC 105346]GLZ29092.1 3-hydroxyacyl-[acyl-carrier-protein] dehydratase FabZ [Lentzea sp. NBRC 105346]
MTGLAEIKALLPHRYPMLLVDRVTSVSPGAGLTAVKAVSCNEPWYASVADSADHSYPFTLVVESWMQAAGLFVGLALDLDVPVGSVPMAGKLSGLSFERAVLPGDVLVHDVRLVKSLSDTVIVAGDTRVGGSIVVSFARVMLAFRPASVLSV